MANPKVIRIKRSAVQGKIPLTTDMVIGELALNTYDGRLFTTISNGTTSSVVQLGADRFTGDVTGSGNGSVALTLANTTVAAGSYGSNTSVGTFTVDSKGRLTAASNVAIAFPVTSVASKTGAVTLAVADIAGAAPLASPSLTGTPTAPTAAVDTNTTQLATTAYVVGQGYLKSATAASTYAPQASPALTGTPTAPTAAVDTNTTQLATTAYVVGQGYLKSSTASTTYAPLASPALTGTPTAPTATAGTNTTQLATTAFVTAALTASAGVTSFNTRQGAIVLNSSDVTTALGFTPVNPNIIGVNNGLATLDSSGKLTSTQIPSALLGAVVYQGVWNASTNSPAITSGSGTKGNYYKVSVAGTTAVDGISQWNVGDMIIYNGTTWDKIDGLASEVTSVAGRVGAVTLAVADVSGAAPLASPTFTGVPAAPTAAANTNTTQIATTAFVLAQASSTTPTMNSTGAVGTSTTFARADHTHPSDTSRAPLASPALTGTPSAPTAAVDTNTTQIATTAYVIGQGYLKSATATSTYAPLASPTLTGVPIAPTAAVDTNTTQIATTAYVIGQGYLKSATATSTYAPLASPALTGTPTAPTATAGTNTTQLATTAFVSSAIGALAPGGVTSFNTRTGAITLSSADVTGALGFTPYNSTNPSGYATLASPTFTGIPAAPTAAVDTNTTQIATTAYVIGQGYLKSSTASATYAPLASPSFTGTITSGGDLTSTDNNQRIRNFSILPSGYVETSPANFRFDQDVLRYINRATGVTVTLNGFTAAEVDNLFSIYSGFVNLINKPDGSSIEITGFSFDNTANAYWFPFVFMHSGAQSRVVLEIKTNNATTTGWQTLYDGSVTGYKIAAVTCANGALIGARWTFYGQGSNNIYVRSIGVIGRNSSAYAWNIMKGGDTMYGDLNFGGTYTVKIQGNTVWHAGNLTNLNQLTNGPGYATLASPTFTGVPAAPTAAINTNTTQLATTAFVLGQATSATPLMDGTAAVGTGTTFARADHVHPTDTSRAPTASPTFTGVATAQNIAITAGIGNSISFWGNNTTYRIAMGNTAEYQYGTITDYAIKFFMGGAAGRGIVFGQDGQTPVAAINTITGDAKFGGIVTAVNGFSGITNANVTGALGYTPLPTSNQQQSYGDYSVPTATYVPITLPNAVTTLTAANAYRITLTTTGTGTDTGAVYIVYQSASTTWNAIQVTASGNTSNYPLLRVNVAGTGLEVYHNHPSTYTIRAAIVMWATGNISIINPSYFGLEGVITAPLGVPKVGSNTIWHAGNLTNLNQLTNGPGYITSSGTATNVSGTVAVANGGTGATTASAALTNLGALPLAGGTMSGTITLPSGKFLETGPLVGALNLNNSDITGLNCLYFNDAADGLGEGINFWRDATHWDTFFALNGVLYFQRNRANGVAGTNDTVLTSANYNTYAPALTGTGASGTWSISVTGSAASVTGTVGVANGGTGATTASAALTNLGAAASGANSDITTLTGLTTAFSLPSGSTAPSLLGSTNNAVVAAGTTQATATALTADINVVTSGTGGVSLPSAIAGRCATVVNKTVSTITVYPATGHGIDGNGANTGISLPANGFIEVYSSAAGQWYSTTNAIINSSYVIGNISGNSANVTGTVAVANGGTGATTASTALSNLGAAASNSPIFAGDITHGASNNFAAAAAPVFKQLGYSTSDQGRLILNHSAANYSTVGVNGTGGIWIGTTSSQDGMSGIVKYLSFDTSGNATFKNPISVANGGTGVATLTGLAYGNGTGAFTAATGAQISAALGTTGISGNAATASRITDQSVGIRLANPGGASYSTQTVSVTGAFKIKLPVASFKSNTMMQFTVKIFEYTTGRSRTIYIGGYNYGDAAANWINVSVSQITNSGGDINVRFGNDGASQCVWIGDTTTVWAYPQVQVTDFQGGYGSTTDAIWGTGWSITPITTFDTVTQGPIVASAPLHSSNYSTYAPSLSGTGATGTWNISISGTAATASALSGFTNSNSSTPITSADNVTQNTVGYVNAGMSSLFGASDGALYAQAYNSTYVHEIYGDYRTGQIAVRGKNNGTWQSWRAVLDSSNFNLYAPTLSGTGATGTWPISVTGNASNVSGIVAVANGGTGATTAANARTNLGAAASGANSDITTLTGLTTAFTLPAASTAAGLLGSANNAVAAAGTTQATATTLTADTNVVTTGTGGVVLPAAVTGKYAVVVNKTSAAINVYPANTHAIDGNGANTAISLPVGGFLEVYSSAAGQWYSTTNAIINGSYVVGNIPGSSAGVVATNVSWTPGSTTWSKTNNAEASVLGSLRSSAATGDARMMIYSDSGKAYVYVDGTIYVNEGVNPVYSTADTIPIANGGTGATTAAAARTNLGAAPLASPTFTGTVSFDALAGVKKAVNTVNTNLGSPTVEEMALFHGEFNNKFRFVPPTLQEESTDGVTWTTSTRASANALADLMIGEGQSSTVTVIPGGTIGANGYYRLTWDNAASGVGYVFLNSLYMYTSTNGNNVTFTVEQYHNTNGWSTVVSASANNWPGHIYIPHNVITFSQTATQYGKVRITFSLLNAINTNPFQLSSVEWFGGYPAGKRNVESYDRNKNVTFPAQVNATGFVGPLTGNAATATKLATPVNIAGLPFDGSAAISPTTSNIAEGTNLYFTNARAQSAISVSGTGLSYASGVITSNAASLNTPSTIMARDSSGNFNAGTATLGSVVTSGVSFINGNTAYTGYSCGLTVGYAGNGSQYGITMKPGTSTADTYAIAFLKSTSTAASPVELASIRHLSGDTGMQLSGTWKLNGTALATTASSITGNAATATKLAAPVNINGVAFDGSANISISPTSFASQLFTATASQTTFTISGGYTVGAIQVYVNGYKVNSGDYVASDGSTVVFNSGLPAGAEVEITAFTTINMGSVSTATNVTGVVAIANGGTGATSAATALSALGGLPIAGGTLTGNLGVKAVLETTNTTSTAITTTQNVDINTSAIWNFTTNPTANFTLNIRGDSVTTLNTVMAVGQSVSIVVMVNNGTTPYYPTAYQIDGVAVTPKWNGAAPTSGNASAIDSYSLTIIKTAASTYTVLASRSKFA